MQTAAKLFTSVVMFLIWLVVVCLFGIFGCIGDILHNRKVRRGDAQYRLPFYLRWRGWEMGPLRHADPSDYKFGIVYDKTNNRIVPIFRSI